MAVPRLAVDRPFTYLLKEEQGAGTGSLVTVPFHRRSVKGWVLGPATDVPEGRLLPIRRVDSPVRFFDERMLRLLEWMSERYIAPLATVIERSHPPRVVSEEVVEGGGAAVDAATPARSRFAHRSRGAPGGYAPPSPATEHTMDQLFARYGGRELLEPGITTWVRPLPDEEQAACVAGVAACLAIGKQAIVLIPEADPVPATALAVFEAFGERVVIFLGGDARERYQTWLRIRSGQFDVVVGTRPAVFSRLDHIGLIWISREVHPGHREDRSPYYHVREVAMARARLENAACVVACFAASVDTAALAQAGAIRVARPARRLEQSAAPLVETVAPQAEGRSPRLTALLKQARSAALIVSRRGYGVARVCRSCGEPAACARCRGPLVVERGVTACRVCGSEGICANCGGRSFGVERGGTERVAEWASRTAPSPVLPESMGQEGTALPRPGAVVVGTAAAVKDVGPLRLDLVAILDADRALARAGIHAGEQTLATWMEAAAWAGPRSEGGRVVLHSRRPAHPAVQALVRWDPVPFLLAQARSRAEAGFAPGQAIFRITGEGGLEAALQEAGATNVLATGGEAGTLCLVAVALKDLTLFRREILRLATGGTVTRVEAEPQL